MSLDSIPSISQNTRPYFTENPEIPEVKPQSPVDFFLTQDNRTSFLSPEYKSVTTGPSQIFRKENDPYILDSLTNNTNWQKVSSDSAGIQVYNKKVTTQNGRKCMAYKGVAHNIVDLTIDQVLEATLDKKAQVGKISHVERIDELYNNASAKIIYQVINFGSIVSKRHNILKYKIVENTDTMIRISWEMISLDRWGDDQVVDPYANSVFTPDNSAVEPHVNQGYVELDLEAQTFTKVFLLDTQTSIPWFLLNKLTLSAMPNNVKEFLNYAKTK